jgi:hypothetical protein
MLLLGAWSFTLSRNPVLPTLALVFLAFVEIAHRQHDRWRATSPADDHAPPRSGADDAS